ncbi:MAG: efflux RND transporter periplasmic adaptor subunit [Chloroflexi bacterium]|nr:efflux RND transporter periplasmic adaptor subunit [Chloroflexota bacterium]
MKRTRILIIGVVVVVVIFVGARFVLNAASSNSGSGALTSADLATATRGTLVATVNASGSIEAAQQADLAFLTGGNVATIAVKAGDAVKAGQVLATLDARELELQLAQAQANLAQAQVKLDQAKQGPKPEDLAAAQQSLKSAQAAYEALVHPGPNDVMAAKADLDRAQAALALAQAAYDRVGGATNPMIGMMTQSRDLQQATSDYRKALAAYNSKIQPTDAQIQQALASITSAQDQLAKLQPSPQDIAAAQTNVDAQTAARDLAALRLSQAKLVAPYDAVITSVSMDRGAYVSAAKSVMTIADLSKYRVTLNVDETDIPSLRVGMPVQLDLDALPDATFTGTVAEIAPRATTVQGVVNYAIRVALEAPSPDVKLGMTANARIETAKKENALLVPSRAIHTNNGKRYVSVYAGGRTHEAEVTLGLSNDEYAEILDGLKEGEQVSLIAPSNVFGGQMTFGSSGSR